MSDTGKILEQFKNKSILIVGEISAAKYNGDLRTGKSISPASAALVSLYAASLGANVSLVGTIGPDTAGSQIVNLLRNKNVNISGLAIDPAQPTALWHKLHLNGEVTPLNIVIEKLVSKAALKQALNAQAILYVCQNQANFSPKILKNLKKISGGFKNCSSIPLAIFSNPAFISANSSKPSELFLMRHTNESKLSKELCKKVGAQECLALNKTNSFSRINKDSLKKHKLGINVQPYKFEAGIAALSILLLACGQYPSYLPQLAKNMRLYNNHMTISQESTVRSNFRLSTLTSD